MQISLCGAIFGSGFWVHIIDKNSLFYVRHSWFISLCLHHVAKVAVRFHWVDFLQQQVLAAQEPLWLNADESAIGYSFPGLKGNIIQKKQWHAGESQPTEKQSKAELRGNITYLALACNQEAMQAQLPQLLIGNKRRFTRALMATITGDTPGNVVILRENSYWMTSAIMHQVLSKIHDGLKETFKEKQVVLMVDTARSHLTREVIKHAGSLGIEILIVPAGLTWLLQPLDVSISFKRWLR